MSDVRGFGFITDRGVPDWDYVWTKARQEGEPAQYSCWRCERMGLGYIVEWEGSSIDTLVPPKGWRPCSDILRYFQLGGITGRALFCDRCDAQLFRWIQR